MSGNFSVECTRRKLVKLALGPYLSTSGRVRICRSMPVNPKGGGQEGPQGVSARISGTINKQIAVIAPSLPFRQHFFSEYTVVTLIHLDSR